MAHPSAKNYWEPALKARCTALGSNHQALLDDYLSLSAILRQYGEHVNAHCAIARMPPELLQHICKLLRDIVEDVASQTPDGVYDSEADRPRGKPRVPVWSHVTQVCRRWRSIAQEDSSLWGRVRLLPIQSWIDRMLSLSKESILTVYARLGSDKKIGHMLYGLLNNTDNYDSAYRIFSLDISSHDGNYATQALRDCVSLPSLERVFIRLNDSSHTTRRELDLDHICARAPNLRDVSISGYYLLNGHMRTPYTSLTRLTITSAYARHCKGGVRRSHRIPVETEMKTEALLRALESLPALQELILDDIVPSLEEPQAEQLRGVRLSIPDVSFRHHDLRSSLPFISVLSGIAIRLSLLTDRADDRTLSAILSYTGLKLPDPEFLSVSLSLVKEVMTVYGYYASTPAENAIRRRHPQELILHLFDHRPHISEHYTWDCQVLFDTQKLNWPINILQGSLPYLKAAQKLTLCVDDDMWAPRWTKEHWWRLARLPARHIEVFNDDTITLLTALAESPDDFPLLEDISVYDEDSSRQIWDRKGWDGDKYDATISLRKPPFYAAELLLKSVRLRHGGGLRPFKRVMLPARYMADAWLGELREFVEVVESQHGDLCHCHKVHNRFGDVLKC